MAQCGVTAKLFAVAAARDAFSRCLLAMPWGETAMIEDRMRIRRLSAIAIIASISTIFAWSSGAFATPVQLDCVLTDTAGHPGSENRPIVVMFDEAAKTLTAKEGDHSYSFSKVSITYISISGQTDDGSLGIDRSSFGIVWQRYAANKVTTEFGHCQPAAPAAK